MSFERLDNGGNNKFPLTNYGSSDVKELAKYGAALGTDTQGVKKIEMIVRVGDDVAATEYDSSIVSVLPKGHVVTSAMTYSSTDMVGTINVGIADKADGTNADADALVQTATVLVAGEAVAGTLAAGVDGTILADDKMVTLDSANLTAGEVKVVITYESATEV